MFVLVGVGGLMAQAQLGPMAKDFGIDSVPVAILGLTLPALTFALSLDRALNGLTRPFFGWISDHIGRENTMFLAILPVRDPLRSRVLRLGRDLRFVPRPVRRSLRQEIRNRELWFALHRQGQAALVVPLANLLPAGIGSWKLVFLIAAVLDVTAALLALFVLKPLRRRLIAAAG